MAKPRINSALEGVAVAATTEWTNTSSRRPAAVYIATDGDFVASFEVGGTELTFAGAVAGSILPISINYIAASSTPSVIVLYTDPQGGS